MGIPFFYGTVINNHSELNALKAAVVQGWNENTDSVSSLSIDFNALIHVATGPIFGREKFATPELTRALAQANPNDINLEVYKFILILIGQVVENYAPRDYLIIAVDGPIPEGKISQQKPRRYISAASLTSRSNFDSNCITPGTPFMVGLHKYLEINLARNFVQLGVKKIIYSSHLVPGEGEHKIFEYFRRGDISGDGYHVLYGADADLILLSMINRIPKLIFGRDSVPLYYTNDMGSHQRVTMTPVPDNKAPALDNIYIDRLRELFTAELKGRSSAVGDFVLMMSLMGNDFLPHPYALSNMDNGVQTLIEAMNKYGKPLTDPEDQSIVEWHGVSQVIKILAESETDLVSQNAAKKLARMRRLDSYRSDDPEVRILEAAENNNLTLFRNYWYLNALGPKQYDVLPKMNYLKLLADANTPAIGQDDVAEMCYHFMRGMAWTYQYYTRGHNSVTWAWSYPFSHAPLLSDLAIMAEHFVTASLNEDSNESEIFNVLPIHDEGRFNVVEQLVAVMPSYSLPHVPSYLHELWAEDSPIADLMPSAIVIDHKLVEKEWQGVPVLPRANHSRIAKAVAELNLSPKLDLLLPAKDYILEMSELDRDFYLRQVKISQENKQRRERAAKWETRGMDRGRGRGQDERSPRTEPERGRGRGRGESSGERGRGRAERGRGRGQGRGRADNSRTRTNLSYTDLPDSGI